MTSLNADPRAARGGKAGRKLFGQSLPTEKPEAAKRANAPVANMGPPTSAPSTRRPEVATQQLDLSPRSNSLASGREFQQRVDAQPWTAPVANMTPLIGTDRHSQIGLSRGVSSDNRSDGSLSGLGTPKSFVSLETSMLKALESPRDVLARRNTLSIAGSSDSEKSSYNALKDPALYKSPLFAKNSKALLADIKKTTILSKNKLVFLNYLKLAEKHPEASKYFLEALKSLDKNDSCCLSVENEQPFFKHDIFLSHSSEIANDITSNKKMFSSPLLAEVYCIELKQRPALAKLIMNATENMEKSQQTCLDDIGFYKHPVYKGNREEVLNIVTHEKALLLNPEMAITYLDLRKSDPDSASDMLDGLKDGSTHGLNSQQASPVISPQFMSPLGDASHLMTGELWEKGYDERAVSMSRGNNDTHQLNSPAKRASDGGVFSARSAEQSKRRKASVIESDHEITFGDDVLDFDMRQSTPNLTGEHGNSSESDNSLFVGRRQKRSDFFVQSETPEPGLKAASASAAKPHPSEKALGKMKAAPQNFKQAASQANRSRRKAASKAPDANYVPSSDDEAYTPQAHDTISITSGGNTSADDSDANVVTERRHTVLKAPAEFLRELEPSNIKTKSKKDKTVKRKEELEIIDPATKNPLRQRLDIDGKKIGGAGWAEVHIDPAEYSRNEALMGLKKYFKEGSVKSEDKKIMIRKMNARIDDQQNCRVNMLSKASVDQWEKALDKMRNLSDRMEYMEDLI